MAQNVKLSTIKKPTVNKTTTIENTTPQRTASDGLSTPNAVINDENRILKSLRSSKIPTIKKLVTTTKSEKVNGLNLQPRIGPSKKSIIPVAK